MDGTGRLQQRTMDVQAWAGSLEEHRSVAALLALLSTFAGVGLILDRPKGTVLEWLALPLLVAGGAFLAWVVWPHGTVAATTTDSMANRLLHRITLGGRLVPVFPALGVGIVLADIGYNLLLSATPAIQTEDTIVLLAAATLTAYRFVPGRFARERDFVLLFFVCLNAILVVPLLIARAYYADFERSVDLYSWVALAPEMSSMLQLIGVSNAVHPVAGSTAPGLTFTPQNASVQVTVVITTACSGIYSLGIFASAFVAFIMTETERPSKRLWTFLGLGLLAAYAANVLRMTVIVLVGYYTDSPSTDLQNMLVAHSYAGWLIFLGWIALFWGALFKFLPQSQLSKPGEKAFPASGRSESSCVICSEVLTPTVPATRCGCGAYYHRRCHIAANRCPVCGRPPSAEPTPMLT